MDDIGKFHEIKFSDPDSVLVIQVPREHRQISNTFINGVHDALATVLPPGRKLFIIGSDINLYELTGADMSILKLRGLLSE